MILQVHAYLAYIILALLLASVLNASYKFFAKKAFEVLDIRLPLFTLIFAHIQVLIGLAHYFMSPAYKHMKEVGMGMAMKDAQTRLLVVEHPLIMLLAVVIITIGFSKHKNKKTDAAKFKSIAVYYGIALILVLSRIPWQQWFD